MVVCEFLGKCSAEDVAVYRPEFQTQDRIVRAVSVRSAQLVGQVLDLLTGQLVAQDVPVPAECLAESPLTCPGEPPGKSHPQHATVTLSRRHFLQHSVPQPSFGPGGTGTCSPVYHGFSSGASSWTNV